MSESQPVPQPTAQSQAAPESAPRPTGGTPPPDLVETAALPFRALLWAGLALLLLGGVVLLIALSQDEYGGFWSAAFGWGFLTLMVQLAIPLLTGAGIIAGLGKRKTGDADGR